MFHFDKIEFNAVLNKIVIYALAIYIFYILGQAVWLNWQLAQQANAVKTQIASINAQNQDLQNLIVYYGSLSFKELEARQELGMKLPDETAVAIAAKKLPDYQTETQTQVQSAVLTTPDSISNWQAWRSYLFGGN